MCSQLRTTTRYLRSSSRPYKGLCGPRFSQRFIWRDPLGPHPGHHDHLLAPRLDVLPTVPGSLLSLGERPPRLGP